jgi:hypothetical protein
VQQQPPFGQAVANTQLPLTATREAMFPVVARRSWFPTNSRYTNRDRSKAHRGHAWLNHSRPGLDADGCAKACSRTTLSGRATWHARFHIAASTIWTGRSGDTGARRRVAACANRATRPFAADGARRATTVRDAPVVCTTGTVATVSIAADTGKHTARRTRARQDAGSVCTTRAGGAGGHAR